MNWQEYKDWQKTREGGEKVLKPDGVKGVPTVGYGYAFGEFDKNGRFQINNRDKINADLNIAKGTQGKEYVSKENLGELQGATLQQIKIMDKLEQLERIGPQLSPTEMDRLQDISIREKREEAAQVMSQKGVDFNSLPEAQQIVLTDLRYRGGKKLLSPDFKLPTAIAEGDMGQAYYEIAYGSNREDALGNDIRNAKLADDFYRSLSPEQQQQVDSKLDDYQRKGGIEAEQIREVNTRMEKQRKKDPQLQSPDEARAKAKEEGAHGLPSDTPSAPTSTNSNAGETSSVLDYFGKTASEIGSAISTAGHMAFDTAMSLGKETLTQTIRQALAQGDGGKPALKQAAQLAVGHILASMNAQVVEQAGWPVGIAGPLKRPQQSVEQVMNDPRNQNVFERMAGEVQRLLGIYPDLDPTVLMADQGLKHIRQGDLKIPQGILLPDMLPIDKPRGEEPHIDVLGMPLPVSWPEVGVIYENPNSTGLPTSTPTDLFAFRDGEGVVQVASYSRGGITVKAHSRSKPDGDVTNNLSYKSKV
ncbi:MAG: hypothetical protein GC129_04740 [Proteobacteria bacterium]|nr:hypothetical protein [Pseudomonadota bacterium]